MGRLSIWGGETGQRLVLSLNAILNEMGRARSDRAAVKNAIKILHDREPLLYSKSSAETLRKGYYKARGHYGDSPPPVPAKQSPEDRWMLLLQQWDSSLGPAQAAKLVQDVVAIADWRRKHIGDLFDILERRTSWNGDPKRKADQIRAWFSKMAADRRYWPRVKQPPPDRDRDSVLALLRHGPKSKIELAQALGRTMPAVAAILTRMLKSGDIVRVAIGVFALPGTEPHVLTREAILKVLTDAGGEVTMAAMCAATGKPKTSVSAALDHLKGLVVRVRRGVYALTGSGAVTHGWARDEILTVLKPGKAMTQAALIAATGRREGAISSALKRLLSDGEVDRVRHGYYVRRSQSRN